MSACITTCKGGLFEELTRFQTPQRRCVTECKYRSEESDTGTHCYADGCPVDLYYVPGAPAEQPNCVAQCETTEYRYEASKQCLTKAECNAKNAFAQDSQCVSAANCSSGTFAYEATGNCEAHEPASDGGFDQKRLRDSVYACAAKVVLDVRGEAWGCTSRLTCLQSGGILAEEETYIDRAEWLSDERNFVDVTFHAAVYDGSGELSAESACAVPGARFVAERACGCGSMYLDMAGDVPRASLLPRSTPATLVSRLRTRLTSVRLRRTSS